MMNRVPKGQSHSHNHAQGEKFIRATDFRCVSFYNTEQARQVIVLYSLGEDGIVREYNGQKWLPFPITVDDE